MARARIILADDHPLFREGLASLINSQADLEVVGQASDGLEALTLVRDLQPDLVIMDIKMPMCDGLEATRLLRSTTPALRILILTIHDEDEKLFEAIKAGASGYLLKNTNSTDFLTGVRSVLAGEAALPSRLAARLLDEFSRLTTRAVAAPAVESDVDLTTREREVLNCIATGATDREIAAQLSLSLHTVKSHVRNILSKLHAVNRRQAARQAARQGLIR
ncbi:MAG: response regulator transcription factor [Caldilineaceae bacterium]